MDAKKITALGVGALVLFGAGGFTGSTFFPTEKTIEVEKEIEKIVEVEKVVEVPVEVEKVVEKNVTVEVPVDNGKLDEVLQFLMDNDGDIEFVTDELDDDEAYKVADYIAQVNELKKLAVEAVQDDLFDELDGVVVSGEELDEDDMERLRIDDDLDEIVIDEADFDDGDFNIIVTGRFEQDDVKYEFEADLKFKDGEFDEFDNIDVNVA